MKKCNFTSSQISDITKRLSPKFYVRINKAGNITVKHDGCDDFWVLYYVSKSNTYVWRKHKNGSCFPLHMTGRTRVGDIHKETYAGKTFTWYNREYNANYINFYTFSDALNYFVMYLKKYRNINI